MAVFEKKVVSIAIAIILAFAAMCSPKSEATQNEANVNTILRERNYPQSYLDLLSLEEKEALIPKRNYVFEKAVVSGFVGDELVWEYEISENGTMPSGQIPSADLTLVFAISKNKYNDKINVRYGYDWRKIPFYRNQDPISVSWDDEKFKMEPYTFRQIDQYRYYDELLKKEVTKTYAEEPGYTRASPAGVTWHAKLYPLHLSVTALHGYGEFDLVPKVSGRFSTEFYGQYIHTTTKSEVSVEILGFGLITASGSDPYDERGTQTSYDYGI